MENNRKDREREQAAARQRRRRARLAAEAAAEEARDREINEAFAAGDWYVAGGLAAFPIRQARRS